jgi:hypothetical protein
VVDEPQVGNAERMMRRMARVGSIARHSTFSCVAAVGVHVKRT